MRAPEHDKTYNEYVFTIRRKRSRIKLTLLKMLSFLHNNLTELSQNFILAPEISKDGRLHIHCITDINDNTIAFRIFKKKYHEKFGMLCDGYTVREKRRLINCKSYVDSNNFLSRFIYLRKESNETLSRIFEIEIPDIYKLLNQDTLEKFLLYYRSTARRKTQINKILTKYSHQDDKYYNFHKLIYPINELIIPGNLTIPPLPPYQGGTGGGVIFP